MKKYILTLSLLFSYVFAEPSAFGAGDLDSTNPYGLSENEKHILKNRNSIKDLNKKVSVTEFRTSSLKEKIEGLKSVLEGQNRVIGNFKSQISDLKKSIDLNEANNEDKLKEVDGRIDSILETFENSYNKQSSDVNLSFNSLTIAIDEITKTLNTIYSNYIPKSELNKHLQTEFDRFQSDILKEVNSYLDKNQQKTILNKEEPIKKISLIETLAKIESFQILSDAKIFYKNKKFNDSKVRFKLLIDRNYKPATSNFYLGEISYNEDKYSGALEYYKTSVGLYDKASYMPTLLLHSAISCEKTNDIDNAKIFYNVLISGFVETKEAKIAKKNLVKLKK